MTAFPSYSRSFSVARQSRNRRVRVAALARHSDPNVAAPALAGRVAVAKPARIDRKSGVDLKVLKIRGESNAGATR